MLVRSVWFVVPALAGLCAGFACAATSGTGRTGGVGGAGTGGGGQGGITLTSTGTGNGVSCQGLECKAQMDACASHGMPATTISGRVYDPAGQLPLYGVYVYIPANTPDPITPGNPTCSQCEAPASGNPVIGTFTDAKGNFTLMQGAMDPWGVPSGAGLTLVLQAGKWRRQIPLPSIPACANTTLPDPASPSAKLRLPAKSSEGDMPLIAFTSGCDPAECFLLHVGIDPSEFVPPDSTTGHVHFYTARQGSSVAGGNTRADTYAWWAQASNLLKYDIVFNACECAANDRGATAYQAMDDYLSGGGRLFATHYYYNWFAPPTGPADEQGIANWEPTEPPVPYNNYYIDTTFPKGKSFADWLQTQGVTQTYGQIDLVDTRYDMDAITGLSTRWIYNADGATDPNYATMYMSFNSPVGHPPAMQCGRAVFSDVHLSGSSDGSQFPGECANPDPTYATNEKALEFLFFDLSSCVQDNSQPPVMPPPVK